MDTKLNRIEDKIDKITDRLNDIDKTLVRNTADLENHMKRTEQNETMIKGLQEDLKPVKSHVALMNNIAKIIVFLGVLAAIYKNLNF